MDNENLTAGSGSSGGSVEALAAEPVLSGALDEVELSVLLVVVELSVLLAEELSEVLTGTVETSASSSPLEVVVVSEVLADELSVMLDDVELTVLLVVEELSTVLELDVDELSEELVEDEPSRVPTEFSASPEQAVIETASAKAVIIFKKRFINPFPFVYSV